MKYLSVIAFAILAFVGAFSYGHTHYLTLNMRHPVAMVGNTIWMEYRGGTMTPADINAKAAMWGVGAAAFVLLLAAGATDVKL